LKDSKPPKIQTRLSIDQKKSQPMTPLAQKAKAAEALAPYSIFKNIEYIWQKNASTDGLPKRAGTYPFRFATRVKTTPFVDSFPASLSTVCRLVFKL